MRCFYSGCYRGDGHRYRFYVAGKFEEKEQVKEIILELEEAGHTITYDWTIHEDDNPQMQALKCLGGVIDADMFIFLAERALPYKGAFVEMGAALTHGKPVLVIGDAIDSCIFMKMGFVSKVANVKEFIEGLPTMFDEVN